ncbi:SpoIIE family protein phosphatase [Streptomyces sp. ACA25]|uniref:SpoIIE family protein phosphatase n=1 Tax=Streptomyces sp. ACA25 TaxID=3022596 RepID=UPI002307740C|nr:SpoIIE family protein phosphatase [Streptomyces sp. ACA25]MDB1087101.1 SpoIIE family protein phosphatase [Streptomyces sp. ACA25]
MSDPWNGDARIQVRAHDRFVRTGHEPTEAEVRSAIRASWLRSASLGVNQKRLVVPASSDLDPGLRLLRAAGPALEQLRHELGDAPVTVLLTDAEARIVDRRDGPCDSAGNLAAKELEPLVVGASCAERHLGTNSISMCLGTRAPFVVIGEEHFFHRLQVLACIGAPVHDPVSGTVQGVVNLSMMREAAHPRMAALVYRAVRRIEDRLLELTTSREKALAAAFLASRDRAGSVLLHPTDARAGPGRAAEALLDEVSSEEQRMLLHEASRMIASEGTTWQEVPLSHGKSALLHRRPVRDGEADGAAVEVSLRTDGGSALVTARPPRHREHAGGAVPAARPAPSASVDRPDEHASSVDQWLLMVGEPGVGRLAVAARERLSLLNEAGARIGTTLDVRRTAQELTEVAVPRLADLAVVELLSEVAGGEEPRPGPVPAAPTLERQALTARPGLPGQATGEAGEVFRCPPETAHARAMHHDRSIREPVVGAGAGAKLLPGEAPWPEPAPSLGEGEHSLMTVPLRSRGSLMGVVGFYRSGRADPFEEDDLLLAEELAVRTATCLDNARRYARERNASLTLQHSLLPRELPELSAVEVASRYFPADEGTDVGGDWYDVIPLSGSRVALVVGDVVGHGMHAAAAMGRLRTAVHTLADLDLPPEEVLAHLDDLVNRSSSGDDCEDPACGATCLYAVYDPVSRICTAARAGHPPPALAEPDGTVRLLDLPVGLPLGLGGLLPYAAAEFRIPEGSTLALYSDGLTAHRGQATPADEDRLDVLLDHLGSTGPTLEHLCDKITSTLFTEAFDRPHDDMALLLARTRALPDDSITEWYLPCRPEAVRQARELTGRQLHKWDLSELACGTELLVSELVTNAVRYGGGDRVHLRLIRDRSLICEVSDHSNSSPRIRRAGTTEEGGRGLFLVAQYSRAWGTRYTEQGKTVWAEQPLRTGPALSRPTDPDEESLLALYEDL